MPENGRGVSLQEMIATAAYFIWEKTGDSNAFANWQTAIEELKASGNGFNIAVRHHELIKVRAEEIWSLNGKRTGRDLEYWLRAENELAR